MTWLVDEERALRGYTVEWVAPGETLASRRHTLYQVTHDRTAGAVAAPVPMVRLAAPMWKRCASRLRPIQRLLRHMVYNVVKLDDESLFITFAKGVGVARGGQYRDLAGLVRPCRVLRGAVAADPMGRVYFGEYLTNAQRDRMRIYRYTPGAARVEIVHEFPSGAVRHIHGIYRDPFGDALWCVTGDVGDECRMLYSTDGFTTLAELGAGDESWRCVSLQFRREHIYYATDAEFEHNRLYRVERASGRRDVVGALDGPVYYSCARGDDLFFAVTVELCPSQVGRSATLWHLDREDQLNRIAGFEKDAWPVSYFLPGTIHFPCGPGVADEFFVQTVALHGVDGRTFRVYRNGKE